MKFLLILEKWLESLNFCNSILLLIFSKSNINKGGEVLYLATFKVDFKYKVAPPSFILDLLKY